MKYAIKKFIGEILATPQVINKVSNAVSNNGNQQPHYQKRRPKERRYDEIIGVVSTHKPFDMESVARSLLNFETTSYLGIQDRDGAIRQIVSEAIHRKRIGASVIYTSVI